MLEIGGREIGVGLPAYVIAEVSANHRQSFDSALALVEAAANAGADAVKLQTYTAGTMTIDCNNEYFQIRAGTVWDGRTLHSLYHEASTPWEWHEPLKRAAEERGLDLFSSPFDDTAVQFLEQLGVPAYKIASFELVDLALVRRVAGTGKPMIMSTGMATLPEIAEAVTTAREAGAAGLALLKCTSAYPSPPSEVNLRTIPHMSAAFDVPVGLSDHTVGVAVPVAAVAVGAVIVEKHLTLSRADGGPDAGFSLEPHEFREMIEEIRQAEQALGRVSYEPTEHEAGSRSLRRSLFVVEDVEVGELFTEANVRSIRPGHGLHTRHLEDVIGRRAARSVQRGTPLSWDLIAGA